MESIKKNITVSLGKIPMYKLVVAALVVMLAAGLGLSATGQTSFTPIQLLLSLLIICGVSYGSNRLFSWLYKARTNTESSLITALILCAIITPPDSVSGALIVALIALVAQASKYVVAYKQRHIFNPAAFGALVVGLCGLGQASWWIGSSALLPLVAVIGFVILLRVRRLQMFIVFALVVMAELAFYAALDKRPIVDALIEAFTSWPLLFFGTIMLTEPFTSPSRKRYLYLFATIAGALFAARFSFGPVYASPALALIIANLFAFAVNAHGSHTLILKTIKRYGSDCYELLFTPRRRFAYNAGQYMEWTLPHKHQDIKGTRRFFTIASAPSEATVAIGIRTGGKASSYKNALLQLQPGDVVQASNLGGEFVLPSRTNKPIVMIAGGIGITPFRSMIQEAIIAKQHYDITLIYLVAKADDVMYEDVFATAKKAGVKIVYVITGKEAPAHWRGEHGRINTELLKKYATDPQQSLFYVSGPSGMVLYAKQLLMQLQVRRKHIKTDYFSGY